MIQTCYLCDREFLTEADPHAWVFVGTWKINCGCFFYREAKNELGRLYAENEELKREIEYWKTSPDEMRGAFIIGGGE